MTRLILPRVIVENILIGLYCEQQWRTNCEYLENKHLLAVSLGQLNPIRIKTRNEVQPNISLLFMQYIDLYMKAEACICKG